VGAVVGSVRMLLRLEVLVKIGSMTKTAAICTTRSRIVGTPTGRSLPSSLGITPAEPPSVDTSSPSFLGQFAKPTLLTVLLDVQERLPVHTRCPMILLASFVGPVQNVGSVHFVVQRIEAIVGNSFALARSTPWSFPTVGGVLDSSSISWLSPRQILVLEVRSFPPPELPGSSVL